MAIVQSVKIEGLENFLDLAKRFTSTVFSGLKESNHVAMVPDRYDIPDSIKSSERIRRQKGYTHEIEILNNSQKLPKNFQLYLDNPQNKINLVNYVFTYWTDTLPNILNASQNVYLANLDGTGTLLTRGYCGSVDLACDHEEADSKMFVFTNYIIQRNQIERVIIQSPDTDVAVIRCYHFVTNLALLSKLWFKTGVGNKTRYIPIHTSVMDLGSPVCRLLPAIHVITGCDSVSSFSGIGNKTAFSILKTKTNEFIDMFEFGESPTLSLECASVIACIKFVCYLYDSKTTMMDINKLRHKLFTQKNVTGDKLPPTLDALTLHLRRANYQCFIWRFACNPLLELPSPLDNGWKRVEGIFEQERMSNAAVPDAIVELTRCNCKKGCKTIEQN